MSRIEYHRNGLVVRLHGLPDGGARVNVSDSSSWTSIPAATVNLWKDLPPDGLIPDLGGIFEVQGPVTNWMEDRQGSKGASQEGDARETPASEQPGQEPPTPGIKDLHRVTVEIDIPELVHLDWETSLLEALRLSETAVVRTSPVRPRVMAMPFTLPLRLLQIGAASYQSLEELADHAFGVPSMRGEAMQFTRSTWNRVSSTLRQEHWRHVDVLHFDQYPRLADTKRLLKTSKLRTRGTLGWLERLCDTFEVRLVVIHTEDESSLAAARRLANAFAARGGPAVLVGDFSDAKDRYTLIESLIHDRPLDGLATLADRRLHQSLFAGCGREELLRVSNVGLELISLAKGSDDPELQASGQWQLGLHSMVRKTSLGGSKLYPKSPEPVAFSLQSLRNRWDSLDFTHEQGGFLPINDALQLVSSALQAAPSLARRKSSSAAPGNERYLNASLWTQDSRGNLGRRPVPSKARLPIGKVVQLGIQLGLHDPVMTVLGAEPLPEQAFQWQPGVKGRWLEVGVTGLDFDVLGDPVQPLWLPRNGPSGTVYFAVVPRTNVVARLRFCIYYQNNVVQSCRLAALTFVANAPDTNRVFYSPSEERRRTLAQALEISPDLVGDEYYLARLEYSLSTNAHSIVQRPPRALSIVANQLDGRHRLTVKGADVFQPVDANKDVGDLIEDLRKKLDLASFINADKTRSRDTWNYAFDNSNEDTNVGTDKHLKVILKSLAIAGRELYTSLFPEVKIEFLDLLATEGQTIHVAHILLEKVIPWAAIYDREYDEETKDYQGLEVKHDVCLAPLKNGSLQPMKCGVGEECPLSDEGKEKIKQEGKTVLEETIVCPLHFWGFKHIIEIPPQQVALQSDSESPGVALFDPGKPSELQECILVKPALSQSPPKARFMMCYGPGLVQAEAHKNLLQRLLTNSKTTSNKPFKISAEWLQPESKRDAVKESLKKADLDLIYLYCHARGGKGDSQDKTPRLEFEGGDIIQSALHMNTPPTWTHHPLVFLNGCGTAAFSPDALSPFIKTLVKNRGAAGVVGTEISVFEQLATEVGRVFLEQLLVGASAGEALLYIRRMLLSKYNPLGLAYTLYASADLRLDIDGDGKCD